ncbi:MAG TPA: CusA/CzcA family heavy metal efflux RND transporter [Kofleriaceae bacterium]|nr:CusA/CzcA family heavy metal efflux RND transporter [Kofleriaceae bacterium]
MIERFVAACLRKRWLVVAIFLMIGALGVYSWRQLSIEAYPDISDTTAQVVTQFLGHAAEEVEEQVTIPLERALNGIPGLHVMRSKSTFGLSLITLVFVDGVEDYWARQRITERISGVELPPGASPGLDPITSPIGEIYRYTLERRPRLACAHEVLPEGAPRGQRELKELQEWIVIPTLRQIYGVADVTNFGGETTQFQLLVDPVRLAQYNLSLKQVTDAITSNNANAGGSIIVRGDQGLVVRGIGLIRSLDDLGNIVVTQKAGTPVFVKNLGTLQLGALERRGILGKDRNPDGVSGIVLLLRGVNPSLVLGGVHAKIEALNTRCGEDGTVRHGLLPDDVNVVPYLDRTELVHTTLHTVSHTLAEGIGLVVLAMLLFLGSARAALIAGITIPLSLLIAFVLMHVTNIPANLLSLGAIDFGIIVDASIVVIENMLRHREEHPGVPMTEADALASTTQVARPIFFAKAIIITAYLPLFAFQRVEKKLFAPMAYSVGYALIGATVIALALIPGLALAAYAKPRKVFRNRPLEWLRVKYEAALRSVTGRPVWWLLPGIAAAAVAVLLAGAVGKEFLPELDEGSIWLQVQLPPGLSLDKASEMAGEVRRAVREFEEVSTVVTQLGRNDDGTDPWTPSHIEAFVGLTPYAAWPDGETKHDLIAKLAKRLDQVPGITVGFSQPMIDGVNDKIAGAHSELVLKVYGRDLGEARRIAVEIVEALGHVPGAADVAIDQEPPLPQLQIHVDREAAARFGINVADIAQLVEVGIGGRAIAQVFLGERRYDIAVRFTAAARSTPDEIGDLTIQAAGGARIPLAQLATIEVRAGESTITRETNRRHLTVKINIRGRDLSSFLEEAKGEIARRVHYDPHLYELVWGGQFENQQRAQARLALVVPVVLGLIFLLLYGAFGTLRHAAIVLANVLLALLGGMAALYLRGMSLNVSSAVGFIALFGVSVQNGVILVSNLNRLRDSGSPLAEAVCRGASERFRPVLMTATVAALGMVPAALAHGIGSDVQRPLATVVVGGLITATILSIFVLPAIYVVVERWVQRRHAGWAAKEGRPAS